MAFCTFSWAAAPATAGFHCILGSPTLLLWQGVSLRSLRSRNLHRLPMPRRQTMEAPTAVLPASAASAHVHNCPGRGAPWPAEEGTVSACTGYGKKKQRGGEYQFDFMFLRMSSCGKRLGGLHLQAICAVGNAPKEHYWAQSQLDLLVSVWDPSKGLQQEGNSRSRAYV